MKITVVFSILLLLTCTPLTAGNYKFRHYTNKDGLSHNTVHCSLQDKEGYVWFGTEEGLNRFDGYTFQVYKHTSQDSTGLSGNSIHSLFEDSKGRIWICTSSGLCYYDRESGTFIRRFAPFENEQDIYFSYVREDKDHNLWFIRGNLIVVYSLQTGKVRQYPPEESFHAWNVTMGENGYPLFSDAQNLYLYQPGSDSFTKIPVLHDEPLISAICEIPDIGILVGTDRDGVKLYRFHNQEIEDITSSTQVRDITAYSRHVYWFGTESGIFVYDVLNRTIEHLTKSLTDEYTLADNAIYSITRDMEGGMWIGSFFGGINYLPRVYSPFNSFIGGKTHPGLLGNAIREICPDQYGNLWIGTEDNGINKYDPQTGEFTNHSLRNLLSPLSATNIHGLYAEGDTLWVGTYNKGIDVLHIPSGKIIQRYTIENTNRALSTNFILCFCKTSTGRFLIGTSHGTIEFDKKTNTFSRWQPIYDLVRQIYEDRNQNIWITTMNGLYRYSNDNDQLVRYLSDKNNEQTLPQNNLTSIYEDSRGNIWVTTSNGLARYHQSTDTFERVYPQTEFPSNILYRILEDNQGMLWISTVSGLVCLHPETYRIRTYSHVDGLHESQFNFSSSHKSPDGTLFFGSINGLISFKPHEFETDQFIPPLHIQTPSSLQEQEIEHTIQLPYNHPTFTLSYAAISFTAPQAIQYAYQLEGIDKNWIYVNHNREVTFANLSPGKYLFKVKSTNSSGIWQENIATLPIIITPPFWATKWAFALYGCILLLVIYIFYQYKKAQLLKRHQYNQEVFENKKEIELYDAKIQFFTFITHEIRTPLTLIKAPLEKIKRLGEASPQTREYLEIIDKNTQRLLDLSTQLLDFRKTEIKGFQLNFIKTDMNLWLDTIITRFRTTLEEGQKEFTCRIPNYPVEAYIDREAFAKMASNLLNNANKYSVNLVQLEIQIPQDDPCVFKIIVINDGHLIPLQEKENIFKPFYRLKENETQPGSGIGLSLVHSLVELHNGTITYDHTPDRMNRFEITLPLKQTTSLELSEDTESEEAETLQQTSDGPLILIVEDQKDMLHFITGELAEHFRVMSAGNGKEALDILQEHPIEVIISDIMMPVMDGYDLCNEIKNNVNFSHIPIILLTAQHSLQARLRGLNSGADAYIEKPFSLELLLTQVNNLLKNRELLKTSYVEKPNIESSTLALSKMDTLFVERLNAFIDENIANEQLNVDMIAAEMGMSTSSLYRKVKGISGLSPVEFIRITRLKKAIQWMKEGEYRINEIAFMAGFSSPAYFSTCFQKQYGKSPSEFIKEI